MYLFCRFSLMPQILSACNNCFTTLNNNCYQKQKKKKKKKKNKKKRINTVWFFLAKKTIPQNERLKKQTLLCLHLRV